MATPGYAGKILLVNLTSKEIKALDTEKYEQFGAGHGMATALFWEFCVEPGDWDLQDAFDPRNMVSLMMKKGSLYQGVKNQVDLD